MPKFPEHETPQQMLLRVRPRFFDQVGHETMYASSGNDHFFTKSCHHQTYQNSDDELRFMYENGQGHLTLFCIVFV